MKKQIKINGEYAGFTTGDESVKFICRWKQDNKRCNEQISANGSGEYSCSHNHINKVTIG